MRKKYFTVIPALFIVAGCVKYTIVPPAVDLTALNTAGLVTLKAADVKGDLDVVATQYFLQEVTAAQRVPVIEFGTAEAVLGDIGMTEFNRDAALAIGEKYGVEAFFVGEIAVTKVKPQIDLAAPLSKILFARTAFDISMKVRLVSTSNGATLWTDSAIRQGTVAAVGVDGGMPVFSIRDKNTAMDEVLRDIAFRLTWDFRPTRRRL